MHQVGFAVLLATAGSKAAFGEESFPELLQPRCAGAQGPLLKSARKVWERGSRGALESWVAEIQAGNDKYR